LAEYTLPVGLLIFKRFDVFRSPGRPKVFHIIF